MRSPVEFSLARPSVIDDTPTVALATRLGLKRFRKQPLRERHLADLSAVESRLFDCGDGARTHYLEVRKDHLLLLLPGWSLFAAVFGHQLLDLSDRVRSIALDHCGTGKIVKGLRAVGGCTTRTDPRSAQP